MDQRKVLPRKGVAQRSTRPQKSSSVHTTNSGASSSTIGSGGIADQQSHVQPQTSGAIFRLEREDTHILFSEAGGPPPESPGQATVGHGHLKKLGNTIKRNASNAHARVGGMVKPRGRLAGRAERRRRKSAEARRRIAEALDSPERKYSFAPSDDAELVSSTHQTGFHQKGQYILRAARNAYDDESELEDQARLDHHGFMLDSTQLTADHPFSQLPDPRSRASITRSAQSSNPQHRVSLLHIPDPAIRRQHGASFHDDNQSTISGYSRVVEFDPELPREPAPVPSEREPARMKRYLSEHRPRKQIGRVLTYSKSVNHRMGADGPASFSLQGGSTNSGDGIPPFSVNNTWSLSGVDPGNRAELGTDLSRSGKAQQGIFRRSDAPSASTLEGMFIDCQPRMENNTQQSTGSQHLGPEVYKQRRLGFQRSSSPARKALRPVHRSHQFAEMTDSQMEPSYAYQHHQHVPQPITMANPYQHEDNFTSGYVRLPNQATPGKRKFEEGDVSEEPMSAKKQRIETSSQIVPLPLPVGHMMGYALSAPESQSPLATPTVQRWLNQRIGPFLGPISPELTHRSSGPRVPVSRSMMRLGSADPEDCGIVQSTETPDPACFGPHTLPTRTNLISSTVLGPGPPLAVYSAPPQKPGTPPVSASPLRPVDSISNVPASPTTVSMDENDFFPTLYPPPRALNQEPKNWHAAHPYVGMEAATTLSQEMDRMAVARESDDVAEQALEMAQMMELMTRQVTQNRPGASVANPLIIEESLFPERLGPADTDELDQQLAYSPTPSDSGDAPPAQGDRLASPAESDAADRGRGRMCEIRTRMPEELTRALAAHLGVSPENVLEVRVKTSLYLDEETWHCQPWWNPRRDRVT